MIPALLAHGIGGVRDLPVPGWLFLYGAALVLVLSFLGLAFLWREPLLDRQAAGRPAPRWLERVALSTALRVVAGTVSVLLLLAVFLAALLGTGRAELNLAPTFVYVSFWLGLVPLSFLLGNVWSVLSPWKAVADAVAWAAGRTGVRWQPLAAYPERLGRVPAAVGLLLFAVLELAYVDPASPRMLAVAIGIYSYATWGGMLVYGRETWQRNGEGFAVYYGLLARIAPLAVRDGRLVVRWPFSGLAARDDTPGTLLFVAVMLGSVGFDGFSRMAQWQNLVADVQDPFVVSRPLLSDLLVTATGVAGLLAAVLFVIGVYKAASWLAAAYAGSPVSLEKPFLLSLVPIALVYAVAHYFSLLVVQGQFLVPLASDPLGRGWDLFGTAGVTPTLNVFAPNTIWYVQVAALVAGHVAGLAVAHDRAISTFSERGPALRSQLPMLALMVLYTVTGLWLLSQG